MRFIITYMKKSAIVLSQILFVFSSFFAIAYFSGDRIAQEIVWRIGSKAKDRAALVLTVEKFNKKLMDVYASGGSKETLDDFPASTEARHEMFRDLGNLRVADLNIIFDLADLEVKEIRFQSSRKAMVKTFEEWNFMPKHSVSYKQAGQLKGLGKYFMYNMLKTEKGWIVEAYFPLEELKEGAVNDETK